MSKYIDKDLLIEHIKDLPTWAYWADFSGMYEKPTKYPDGTFDVDDVINSIENAPEADVVEVKHGEWLLKHIGTGHYWECSECHTNPCIYVTKDTKYCPNCGVRMDGDNK